MRKKVTKREGWVYKADKNKETVRWACEASMRVVEGRACVGMAA